MDRSNAQPLSAIFTDKYYLPPPPGYVKTDEPVHTRSMLDQKLFQRWFNNVSLGVFIFRPGAIIVNPYDRPPDTNIIYTVPTKDAQVKLAHKDNAYQINVYDEGSEPISIDAVGYTTHPAVYTVNNSLSKNAMMSYLMAVLIPNKSIKIDYDLYNTLSIVELKKYYPKLEIVSYSSKVEINSPENYSTPVTRTNCRYNECGVRIV